MGVAAEEREFVLDHEGRDPHVVGRYRGTRRTEIPKECRVVARSLQRRRQYVHSWPMQERLEDAFVLRPAISHRESGPEFRDDDQRDVDSGG